MQLDAVCDYVDNVEASTYLSYSLPDELVDLPPNQASLQQYIYIDRYCKCEQNTSRIVSSYSTSTIEVS